MDDHRGDVRGRDHRMAVGAAEHSNGVVLTMNCVLLPALLIMRAALANLLGRAEWGRWHGGMPG
jgi:hypothetical protein